MWLYAISYHSTSGGNNLPLNRWIIHLYNSEGSYTYCICVHRHACTWFICEYVSTSISCDHNSSYITWSWKSFNQYIATVFRNFSTQLYLASYTFMHGGWWIQRRKMWMRKKKLQTQIWSRQPYNYIYIAMHECIMNRQ